MATNTLSAAFRKIDVDQYNEDNYREDEVTESQSPPAIPDESEITQLLNQYGNGVIMNDCHIIVQKIDYLGLKEDNLTTLIAVGTTIGNSLEALKAVLKNAPLASRNPQVKESALNLTMKVLMSFKSSQVDEAVGSLDVEMIDTLMKYIYKGFEYPTEKRCGQLLLWHEKVYSVGGVGSIVRVLTDHKRA